MSARPAAHRGARRVIRPAVVEPRPRRWLPGTLFPLSLRDTGVELGVTAAGARFSPPLLQPAQPTRVGVTGVPRLTRVLALRLIDASCALTVLTPDQDQWRRLLARVPGATYEVVSQVSQWPPEGSTAPWALIADADEPPPPGFGRSPWSVVVHASSRAPHGSAWWQSAQYLFSGRAQAASVLNVRPRLPQDVLARMRDDEMLCVEPATATLFRPTMTDDEARLLTSVDDGAR